MACDRPQYVTDILMDGDEKSMIEEMDMKDYVKNHLGRENTILIDTREKQLYEFGTIPGAIHIPLDNIRQLYHLPHGQDIYVFCQAGELSREMVELLSDAGYHACNLAGGYREYLRTQMTEEAD